MLDWYRNHIIMSSKQKFNPANPYTQTQARWLTYIFLIPLNSLPPTSYIPITWYSAYLLTLSYALSRSIIPAYTLPFFSCAFSPVCFRVKIWSTHPSLLWTPLAHHQSNPQSLYGLYLLGFLHIFFHLHLIPI